MDEWIAHFVGDWQLQGWKPIVTALVMPPVPLLLLILLGFALARARRAFAWVLVLSSSALLWLSCTMGMGSLLDDWLLDVPPALSIAQIAEIKSQVQARKPVAIVVLGGGRDALAPEYATANLMWASLERLRYGLWLARETGAPVGFSGGIGWAQTDSGATEADIAARIAQQDFNRPLRWVENRSRDTRENAKLTTAMLKTAGIHEIVLVTHGWHMPRALRAFREAAAGSMEVTAAPMGLARLHDGNSMRWLPTGEGFFRVRQVMREALGLLVGS